MGNIVTVELNVKVPQSRKYEGTSQPDRKDKSVEEKKNLTVDEFKKEKIFKDFNKAIDKIKQIPDLQINNGKWNRDLLKSLSVFLETYSSIEKTFSKQYDLIQNYQREAGQSLSKSKSTSKICKAIMEGLEMSYRDKAGKPDAQQFKVISQSLLTLMNYSDCTPEVTKDIAREPSFLENIKKILTSHMQKEAKVNVIYQHMIGYPWQPVYYNWWKMNSGNPDEEPLTHGKLSLVSTLARTEVHDEEVMKWCLTIYYNTSTVDSNIPRLRSLDIVPVFSSFLDAQVEISRLTALSTLANIIDEKESTEILQGKPDVIAFLLKKLGLALKDPHHRDLRWSAQKCARTVCRLARNDANKTLLVEMGCLSHLVELAKCGNVEEQREAVGAIQILSLKKDNHIKIVDDTRLKIVDVLIEIKLNSSDKEVRKAVDITFWNLREELQKNNNYNHIANQSEPISGRPVKDGKGHIMISYNWDHQKELIKIRDILKEHGYDVWMDIDRMTGAITEAMAKAVEEAYVILICMSQKYKGSPNCKAEAEYAFSLKKKIIPLMMENGYKPDGWLGLLLGVRPFIDFSGKYPFEAKVQDLMDEIANLYSDEHTEPIAVPVKS